MPGGCLGFLPSTVASTLRILDHVTPWKSNRQLAPENRPGPKRGSSLLTIIFQGLS